MVCSSRLVKLVSVVLVLMAGTFGTCAPGSAMSRTSLSVIWSTGKKLAEQTRTRAMRMRERVCMALALYHEARGEPLAGQVAVALTILNRVASPVYPSSVCKVVFQGPLVAGKAGRRACQFSFTCDDNLLMPRNPEVFLRLFRLGKRIMDIIGHDPGRAASAENARLLKLMSRFANVTHFHRYDIRPSWSRRMRRISRIGRHVFFTSRRVTGRMPPTIRLKRLFLGAGITNPPASSRI